MLYTMTKRLEICIDLNIQFSEVDHYTWIFTSRIFRLALEITFLLNKYRKLNKPGIYIYNIIFIYIYIYVYIYIQIDR